MLSPNPSSHLLSCSDPATERSIEMQEENFRNVMKMKTTEPRNLKTPNIRNMNKTIPSHIITKALETTDKQKPVKRH